MVKVYGDTNSTLAGALAAAKLHIPVAHVEAGLRSFNMKMPEEINRILTDQISDILFCPTLTAVQNLQEEGFGRKPAEILQVGDVMQDATIFFSPHASRPDNVCANEFILATLHRAENTDDAARLRGIVEALNELHSRYHVVLPLHPRTRGAIDRAGIQLKVQVIDPVGYLEMLWLLQKCELVLTDSGGVQKEAFFFRKPCVTTRDQTEWVELVQRGANVLAGANTETILDAVSKMIGITIDDSDSLYGGGEAVSRIIQKLVS